MVGYQRWHDLLFIHWRVSVEEVRRLIPPQLTVDTFDGSAWVGLVPFRMSGVRPRWCPPVPGASAFPETNLRTYVHHEGANPGVWFFSLDAASSLAVRAARLVFSLPYFRARMTAVRHGRDVRYTGTRQWPEPSAAGYDIAAVIDEPASAAGTLPPDGRAAVGTLEHFLIERYLLYTTRPGGRLMRGQVHHRPYPLRAARLTDLRETLRPAHGIPPTGDVAHIIFSDGVQVEIFSLEAVERPGHHGGHKR